MKFLVFDGLRVLEGIFVAGILGSMCVVLLSAVEDLEILVEKHEETAEAPGTTH